MRKKLKSAHFDPSQEYHDTEGATAEFDPMAVHQAVLDAQGRGDEGGPTGTGGYRSAGGRYREEGDNKGAVTALPKGSSVYYDNHKVSSGVTATGSAYAFTCMTVLTSSSSSSSLLLLLSDVPSSRPAHACLQFTQSDSHDGRSTRQRSTFIGIHHPKL